MVTSLLKMKWLSLYLVLLAACQSPTNVLDLLDGLRGATQFTPPAHYRELWNGLERCSGLHANFDAVRWYRTPELVVRGQRDAGVYFAGPNIIVLPERILNPSFVGNGHDLIIEHEEMHALLRGVDGHPPKYFNGVCGWLVP
jgi:hypothetical protein